MTGFKLAKRILIYAIGMLVLAFGLSLSAETDLGTSALTSVPYVATSLSGISLGNTMMVMYVAFVFCQIIIKRDRRYVLSYLLQIPVTFVFTRVMDLIGEAIDLGGTSLYIRIICMLISVSCVGLGSALALRMRIIANPGDGFVQTVAERLGKPIGNIKNIVDISFVMVSSAVGLICFHRLEGVGIGTVLSMIGVGRVIALTNWACDRLGLEKY